MHKRHSQEDGTVAKCELKKDNSGVPYVEMKCQCSQTNPRTVYLRQGLDSRYYVGRCSKCERKYIVKVAQ